MSNKMWGGRFASGPAEIMEEINASIDFDRALAPQDIAGSLAHVAMLAQAGIVEAADADAIARGLDQVKGEIEAGAFRVLARARRHPYERREPARRARSARRRAGCTPPARATIRSRPISSSGCATPSTRSTARSPSCRRRWPSGRWPRADMVMPGFTHLQSAQPVTFGHHLLAYVEMLGARPQPLRRRARAAQRMPARRRGARRHLVPDRPRGDRAGARLRPADRQFARQRRRPRFRAGGAGGGLDLRRASLALRRGDRAVDDAAVRLRAALRRVLDRLLDHAAEAQPRCGRAGARQDRPRRSARWSAC